MPSLFTPKIPGSTFKRKQFLFIYTKPSAIGPIILISVNWSQGFFERTWLTQTKVTLLTIENVHKEQTAMSWWFQRGEKHLGWAAAGFPRAASDYLFVTAVICKNSLKDICRAGIKSITDESI